jgi:hypothetical protein
MRFRFSSIAAPFLPPHRSLDNVRSSKIGAHALETACALVRDAPVYNTGMGAAGIRNRLDL